MVMAMASIMHILAIATAIAIAIAMAIAMASFRTVQRVEHVEGEGRTARFFGDGS